MSFQIELDMTPEPSLLLAFSAQSLTWELALSELIDNSLDQAATRVDLNFSGSKSLEVVDDGNGCPDLQKMLRLGKHLRQPTTKLGKFGVGLKEAATWLWGVMNIETVHNGVMRQAAIDWAILSKKDNWKPHPGEGFDAEGKVGTRLLFKNIVKGPPKFDALADELGYTFMPALKSGQQIRIIRKRAKTILCRPYELPPLEHTVKCDAEINGKTISINAGIVDPSHANKRPGFAFVFAHRVIMGSSLGSNGFSTARVAGIIELKSGWSLSKNKNSVIDDDSELGDLVYANLKDMLALAQNQAIILSGEAFASKLNAMFRHALGSLSKSPAHVKEKREKPKPGEEQHGAVKPQNTGRKRKPRKTQPADALADMAQHFAKNGKIDFRPFDSDTFGEVDLAGNVVWLNENNLTLSEYRASDNLKAILNTAMGLFVFEVYQSEQRDKFPMFRSIDKFAQAWARTMSTCEETEKVSSPST